MHGNIQKGEWGIVVNMIEMEQRDDARITASSAGTRSRLRGFEVVGQQMRRTATRPFVEITEYDSRR